MDQTQIKKLAALARIEISDEELASFSADLGAILAYVDQVRAVTEKVGDVAGQEMLDNVARIDIVTRTTGEYTDSILALAPDRDGNYVKVKKIL